MMRRLLLIFPLAASLSFGQCVMCSRTAASQNQARMGVIQQGIWILGIPPVGILTFFLALAYKRRKD
jgi:hypothetical protein